MKAIGTLGTEGPKDKSLVTEEPAVNVTLSEQASSLTEVMEAQLSKDNPYWPNSSKEGKEKDDAAGLPAPTIKG